MRPIQNPTISAQTQLNTHANLVPYFVSKLVLSTADLSDSDKRNALLCASTASTLRLASLVFGAGTPVSGPLNDTIRMSYFRYCMGSYVATVLRSTPLHLITSFEPLQGADTAPTVVPFLECSLWGTLILRGSSKGAHRSSWYVAAYLSYWHVLTL